METQPPIEHTEGMSKGTIARLVIGALILIAIVVFCALNTDSTKVDYLFGDSSPPLFVVIVVSVIAGVVLGALANWRHRRRVAAGR